MHTRGVWPRRAILGALVGILALLLASFQPSASVAYAAASGNWPTYQGDNGRSGFNSGETAINPTSAPHLKLHWVHTATGTITAQPVTANNLVYWGSWDNGTEHATNLSNGRVWTQGLGTTTDSACNPTMAGVSSTSTVATINGRSMLFVGGGDAHMYALDALTGAIIWRTSLGSSPSHFLWGSPAVYNGNVYMGVASFGDCPLVQGQVVELSAANGALLHTFNTVPNGCNGGGVSGSVTIDEAANVLYFVTGNHGSCGSSETLAPAIVEVSTADLSLISSWTIPASEQGPDSDFISTPTLFTSSGGTPMVGVANKNGIFYGFDRTNIGSGPRWRTRVANVGDCPQCGGGSISSAAWDGQHLYVAGGNRTLSGTNCKGTVNSLNPDNGAFVWQHCLLDGPVLGTVTAAPGVVVLGQGRYVMAFATSNGATLFRFEDTNPGSTFWAGASISNGVIYIGNVDGRLYAIGT